MRRSRSIDEFEPPPSLAVVLRCTRPAVSKSHSDRVRTLVADPAFEWDRVVQIARYQGVTPLLYTRLQEHCSAFVPHSTLTELRDRYRSTAVTNHYMTAVLLELLDRFQRRGIRVIPYKGPTLAQAIYGDITMRRFTDLDLLVAREDIEEASSVLEEDGYEWLEHPLRPTGTVLAGGPLVPPLIDELKFHHETNDVLVEIGWQIHKPSAPVTLDYESLWTDRTPVSVPNGTVGGLGAVDRLLVLAHHGSRHRWASLKWVCDFAAATRQADCPSWDRIIERAADTGIERRLLLAAGLAGALLDVSFPPIVERRIRDDARVVRLVDRLSRQYAASPLSGPDERLDLPYRLQTTDSCPDALVAATAPLFPKLTEYRSLPLPRHLFACYYLVRPVRLFTTRVRSILNGVQADH